MNESKSHLEVKECSRKISIKKTNTFTIGAMNFVQDQLKMIVSKLHTEPKSTKQHKKFNKNLLGKKKITK